VSYPRHGEPLFQYLGKLHRPKQIAFVLDAGRFVYDFRAAKLCLPDGTCVGEARLTPADRERFVALVRYWERLRLAQASHEARVAAGDGADDPQ
jgi:hypothetical protein